MNNWWQLQGPQHAAAGATPPYNGSYCTVPSVSNPKYRCRDRPAGRSDCQYMCKVSGKRKDWCRRFLYSSADNGKCTMYECKETSFCAAGTPSSDANVCCKKECGQCGGKGCAERPGGSELCCRQRIMEVGRQCQNGTDTVCLRSNQKMSEWEAEDMEPGVVVDSNGATTLGNDASEGGYKGAKTKKPVRRMKLTVPPSSWTTSHVRAGVGPWTGNTDGVGCRGVQLFPRRRLLYSCKCGSGMIEASPGATNQWSEVTGATFVLSLENGRFSVKKDGSETLCDEPLETSDDSGSWRAQVWVYRNSPDHVGASVETLEETPANVQSSGDTTPPRLVVGGSGRGSGTQDRSAGDSGRGAGSRGKGGMAMPSRVASSSAPLSSSGTRGGAGSGSPATASAASPVQGASVSSSGAGVPSRGSGATGRGRGAAARGSGAPETGLGSGNEASPLRPPGKLDLMRFPGWIATGPGAPTTHSVAALGDQCSTGKDLTAEECGRFGGMDGRRLRVAPSHQQTLLRRTHNSKQQI